MGVLTLTRLPGERPSLIRGTGCSMLVCADMRSSWLKRPGLPRMRANNGSRFPPQSSQAETVSLLGRSRRTYGIQNTFACRACRLRCRQDGRLRSLAPWQHLLALLVELSTAFARVARLIETGLYLYHAHSLGSFHRPIAPKVWEGYSDCDSR